MKINLQLLNKKRFLPIFLCQFLGAFNDNVYKNALVIIITYKLAGQVSFNPSILVTLAAGIFILPFFLFSAIAGQVADKFDKAKCVRWIKFLEIIIMIFGALALYSKDVPFMFLVLFLTGVQSAFFGPIKYSILPQHLYKDELLLGNAFVEGSTFVAILLGTIMGSIFAGGLEYGMLSVSIIIVAFSVLGWLASLYIPNAESSSRYIKIERNIIKSTFDILAELKKNRDVYLSVIGISWFWLIGATFISQFPAFAKNIIRADETVVTLFFSTFSIGIAVGSLLCSKLLRGHITARFIPLGAIGITIFSFDLYFASQIVQANLATFNRIIDYKEFLTHANNFRVILDIFFLSIFGGIYVVPLYAIMQSRSDENHRSRVVAANNIMNALFMVISAVIASIMLSVGVSVLGVFLTLSIANLFATVYVCQLLPDAILRGVIRGTLKFLFRVEVKGLKNYFRAGEKVVIIANHTSFLDAPLLAAFLPEKPTFAINTVIAGKWWVKPGLLLVKAFSMNPGNPMATKYLIDEIKKKEKVIVFPEGRITVTGSLMKVYEGPGMIADRAGATILPIRIDGAQFSYFSRLRGKVRMSLFPKVTITILPSTTFSIPKEVKGRARRKLIGGKLYDIMSNMMFESANYRRSLFKSLIDAKDVYGGKQLIAEDIERKPINYKQFITRCFILGKKVANETIPGENVGILLPNSLACVVSFFALHAYGRVPAMLNFSTGAANMVHAIKIAKIKQVYTSRKFVEAAHLEEVIGKLSTAAHIVYLEDLRGKINIINKLVGLMKGSFPRYFYRKYYNNMKTSDPAVVLFTSGSEGTPKGVVLSHENIQANRLQLAARIDFHSKDRVFNALPIFHSFGLTAGTILPILSGIKTFFYPSPLHYRMIPELVYDTDATMMFGTDTFLSGYAKFAHNYDFYSVRYVFAGAERLKPETRKIWSEKFGIRIFEGYGATETAPVLCVNTPMHNKDGTVGRFIPGLEYYLKPVEGIDEGGRLVVNGPNVMLGYLNAQNPGVISPCATEKGEGWYDTGDIVSVDDFGYVKIMGRVKRFAKVAGEMVSLTFIEEYVSREWIKGQHAVVSVPDIKKGEQTILITDVKDLSREMLLKLAREKGIGEIFIPRKIIHVDNIPVLATGKTDYVSLQKMVDSLEKD